MREQEKVIQLVLGFEPLPSRLCSTDSLLTEKRCRAFELCPTSSVKHGADVRNCAAMGILEVGSHSIRRRRGGLKQECKQRLRKSLG